MDFNTVLQEVGDFNLYQKLLCLFLVIPSASLCALVYFTQFFTILIPDHRCKLYDGDSFNISAENSSIPVDEEGKLDMCRMYAMSNGTRVVENESLVGCSNGWVFDFEDLYPTIATEVSI